MAIECQCCGEEFHDPLPEGTTEQQARQALREVILWYAESPIREIQMAEAACGRRFPIRAIEAALLTAPKPKPKWITDYEKQLMSDNGPSAGPVKEH